MIFSKNTKSLLLKSNKKGFTLTEIAIVLGIIGMILGAIWVASGRVYANQKNTKASIQIMTLAQNIRKLYITANTTAGLTLTDLIAVEAAPPDMVIDPATLSSPYGNGTTVVVPSLDGAAFMISMSALSTAECIRILSALGGDSRDPGLFGATASTALPPAPLAGEPPLGDAGNPILANLPIAPINGSGHFGGCNAASSGLWVNFSFTLR